MMVGLICAEINSESITGQTQQLTYAAALVPSFFLLLLLENQTFV